MITNIINLVNLPLPGQVSLLMEVIDKTLNFNLLQISLLQNFMITNFPILYEIIDFEGELFCIGVSLVMIIFLIILQNMFLKKLKMETPKFFIDLKDNLMWGAILRVIFEGYS